MASRSGRSSLVVVLVLVIAGMLLAYAYFRAKDATTDPVPKTFTQVDAGVAPPPMSDEERAVYVKEKIRLEGLEIGPNMKPGLDEPVPGLLEVHGTVLNDGDRPIDRVFLNVYPKDENGEVIGSYVENVTRKGGLLQPGQSREFKFTIPESKDYAGTFDHMLN